MSEFGAFDELALQQVRERRLLIDRCDAWLFEDIMPFIGQRILEVGCGMGNLVRHIVDRQLVVGIDLSEHSIEYIKTEYRAYSNVQPYVGDIANSSILKLAQHKFDTGISLNVFEHIQNDSKALEHVWQLLMPGGRLILIVPALQWLYGSMDRSIGHYRRYTKLTMASKLRAAGFEVETQKYMNMLGMLGWFLNGRILHQTVPPVGQLKLFNAVVPLVHQLEKLVTPPIGLTLLSVAKRPIT